MSDEQHESSRCPTCGFVMCQEFDYKPINSMAELAIPTGKYSCLHCEKDKNPALHQSSPRYALFEHMAREHGLTLLESEMDEICNIVLTAENQPTKMSDNQLAQRIATDINGHEARTVSRVRIIGIVHKQLAADPTLKQVCEALSEAQLEARFRIVRGKEQLAQWTRLNQALAALERLMGEKK